MNVVLDNSLWVNGTVNPLDLVATLSACAGRRHLLILNSQVMKHAHAWIDKQFHAEGTVRRKLRLLLDEHLRLAPQAPSDRAQITVIAGQTDWMNAQLNPAQAARLLQRPLKLLVENSRNDRAFLLLMAEPSDRSFLTKALDLGWVEFEMGGGLPEMMHRVTNLANAHLGDHTAMIERARLWVMFDRDASSTDRSKESEHSNRLRTLASTVSIPWNLSFYQLKRRAIENYVPSKTLLNWWPWRGDGPVQNVIRERLVKAFLTEHSSGGLSEQAKHSYNMKRGLLNDLPKKRREEISKGGPPLMTAELDPLFRTLSASVLMELQKGGGFTDLMDAFSEPGAVEEAAFREEVGHEERRALLSSLIKRI